MRASPGRWPTWLFVLILAVIYGFGSLVQPQLADGWRTATNLVGGAIVMVIGVTLIERYRRWRGIDGENSKQ